MPVAKLAHHPFPKHRYGARLLSTSTTRPMIRRHATAEDFKKWEAKAASMTSAELLYTIKDCKKVADCWDQDQMVQGFYLDQCYTFADELARRRNRK